MPWELLRRWWQLNYLCVKMHQRNLPQVATNNVNSTVTNWHQDLCYLFFLYICNRLIHLLLYYLHNYFACCKQKECEDITNRKEIKDCEGGISCLIYQFFQRQIFSLFFFFFYNDNRDDVQTHFTTISPVFQKSYHGGREGFGGGGVCIKIHLLIYCTRANCWTTLGSIDLGPSKAAE